ncbi:Retrovirus-related Pol polyprotein from transposon 297 [Araneus ventricosus]|uniref:RNA-directed DNA polymerase n=1 Tax=Araneus ventricosus TaxID=182803 RepID=A0A4Y2K6B0_ARAVE|nr:Retrovirus-related Pol polyprotein from transposon 297 [Araneus ventricosus]
MCHAAETSKLQAQVYFTEERSIDAIKRFKPSPEVKHRDTGQANKFRQPAKRQESSGRKCHYCGSHHVPDRCPACGKQCRSCGKRNHFSRACKSKSVNRVCQNSSVEFTNSANRCKYPPEQFFVSTVRADSMSSSRQAILLINDRPVNFKIDTGAQANIISKKLLNDIYGSGVNVRKTSVKLSMYTGQTIQLLGCTTLPANKDLNSPVIHLDFLVTKNSYQPILGVAAFADKLGLIRKCDNVNSVNCCKSISNLCKYNHVFEGLGNLPGKYRITLCENSVPVVCVTRKVAFSLLEPLKADLDRMVNAGVIEKVTEPTDWVSPLVIVQKKNGALRVCLDPQNLNRAIKRPQCNLPTFEDITTFFDPRVESEIVVDASPFGLGAVLQQRGKPIAFASSTSTPAQRNYAHIEKELLVVVYECKKFHQYVYGTKFKIYSDHKPLIAMSKKPLSAMSSRMQRFYLQLQCYDYEIFYKPGKEMFVSDTLSRAPLIKNHFPTAEEDSLVLSVLDSLPISDIQLQEISDANKSYPIVQRLKSLSECGWDNSKGVSLSAKKYLQYKDELYFVDNLLFKLNLIVVPESTRREILNRLHEGHFGIVKTISMARTCVFWPGTPKDIKEMIEKCPVCAKFQIGNAPEPEMPHEFPTSPWVKVAIDFYFNELISDGGPPFNSPDFDCFAKSWKFKHEKVSAQYPKSNGQVERTIQTVKKIFRKTFADSKDSYLALLLYRATPALGSIYSPAELLMNRKLSAVLSSSSIHKGVQNESYYNYQKRLRDRRAKIKSYRRTLPELRPGSSVFVQNRVRQWEPAKVLRQNEIPRSYRIRTYNGEVRTRNRIHLRPNKCSDFASFKNFTASEEYSTSDAIPDSTPTVRSQEPVDEPASNFQSSQESCSYEPISRSPDKGPYRTRYGRVAKPPSRYVAKF